jgi:hypothetical protein
VKKIYEYTHFPMSFFLTIFLEFSKARNGNYSTSILTRILGLVFRRKMPKRPKLREYDFFLKIIGRQKRVGTA